MKLPIIAVLVLATALGGCARLKESRFNPLNWFGQARVAEVTTLYVTPEDPRALVAQVTTLKVEPYPGGAIVRATGVPPTQGYWDAELVAQPLDENGRLVFEFRVFPPPEPVAAGTPYSRQITVAAALSTIALQGVSTIVVQGAGNALSAGR
jgi:hypothetical protein